LHTDNTIIIPFVANFPSTKKIHVMPSCGKSGGGRDYGMGLKHEKEVWWEDAQGWKAFSALTVDRLLGEINTTPPDDGEKIAISASPP
jgi:hypothetical protein